MVDMAAARRARFHAHEPQGEDCPGRSDELSFTSFRHGGLTETGDAELTREILAQMRHTTVKVLPKHHKADRHRHQEAARGANERRTFVRNEQQHACPNERLGVS